MSLLLQNATYRIGNKELIKSVTIFSEPGHLTAIVGPNGAGKSTALKLMCGDLQLTEGTASVNKKNIYSYTPKELAGIRAVLPQQTSPAFGCKVWEVVALGRAPFDETEIQKARHVEEVLSVVDALYLANRDLETLSGGEKQRVLLAKALIQVFEYDSVLNRKKYLLLDEPTASLDLKQTHVVMKILRKAADSGLGVLLVIHDLAVARSYGDTVFVMKNGKINSFGAPNKVLTLAKIAESFDIDMDTAAASFSLTP